MTRDIESEWSLAFGEDVEIYELQGEFVLHIAGVFHGLFATLTELEWELDAIYQARDEENNA